MKSLKPNIIRLIILLIIQWINQLIFGQDKFNCDKKSNSDDTWPYQDRVIWLHQDRVIY